VTRTQPKLDGRHLRAVRTRAAIVAAIYDLVREGDPAPTAARVAARAGVALRSIGQHFPSREALLAAVAEHHDAQVAPTAPPPSDAPLATRLDALVAARADELERTAPLRRAIAAMPPSRAVHAAQHREQARRRAELAAAFAPELAALPAASRRTALDRLYLVACGSSWDVLRGECDLGVRDATRALRDLLAAQLPSTSASRTSSVSKRNGLRRKPAAPSASTRSRS